MIKRKIKHAIVKIINPTLGTAAENTVCYFHKMGGTFLVNSGISYAPVWGGCYHLLVNGDIKEK